MGAVLARYSLVSFSPVVVVIAVLSFSLSLSVLAELRVKRKRERDKQSAAFGRRAAHSRRSSTWLSLPRALQHDWRLPRSTRPVHVRRAIRPSSSGKLHHTLSLSLLTLWADVVWKWNDNQRTNETERERQREREREENDENVHFQVDSFSTRQLLL